MPGADPGPPTTDEYAPFYQTYVGHVPAGPIVATLEAQVRETLDLLRGLSEPEAESRQPPYTWTFKDVVGHLADTERVLAYRALRIARGDTTPLAGFEQDDYAREAHSTARPLADLLAEFLAVRESTLWLFRGLDAPAWQRMGTANNSAVSVRALAHVIAGHERHHVAILRGRVARLRG